MSRFESRLLAEIERGDGRLDGILACLAWAAYRARIGDIESAKRVVAQERSRDSKLSEAQIFAHINYVEGLCQYFERGLDFALKKFLRASVLAAGCPQGDCLPFLIHGWLAALYRNQGRWKLMVDSLLAAADQGGNGSSEVGFRVCLVAADVLQELGVYVASSDWYDVARRHALAIGDDAAISAMLYNRAAIRVFNASLDEAAGLAVTVDDDHIALQASSAQNYTQYIHDESMRWGFDLMVGQVHMLRGDYVKALSVLESSELEVLAADWPNLDCVRQADIFRCRAQIGELTGSPVGEGVASVLSRIETLSAPGDRVIALYSVVAGMRALQMPSVTEIEEMLKQQHSLLRDDRRCQSEEFQRFIRRFGSPLSISGLAS